MSPAYRPSALLFDLDGTLTDPAEGITRCLAHALEQMGAPVPPHADLCACIGPPLQATFPRLLDSDDPERTRRAIALYRERFGAVGKYENAVYPGIAGALAALRWERRLFVATSKPTVYAVDIVRHFGLAAFFDGVYGSELSGERSDKAQLIAHVREREHLSVSECAMIGDRRHDVEGARANGVPSIGVLWGYGSRDELEAAGADALCARPDDLPGLLGGGLGKP